MLLPNTIVFVFKNQLYVALVYRVDRISKSSFFHPNIQHADISCFARASLNTTDITSNNETIIKNVILYRSQHRRFLSSCNYTFCARDLVWCLIFSFQQNSLPWCGAFSYPLIKVTFVLAYNSELICGQRGRHLDRASYLVCLVFTKGNLL